MEVRDELRAAAEAAGVARLSFVPIFVKAASLALTHFPVLNASVDDKCENITYKVRMDSHKTVCLSICQPFVFVLVFVSVWRRCCWSLSILEGY